jgi:phage gp36-like protein
MAWTTPVNVSDVRTEYPLLTVDLCSDARVTANRDRAEAEIEAVLRDRYDLTDPGADKYVWRICLALTIYHCLNSVYGEEGWTGEGRAAVNGYWQEWHEFKEDVSKGKIKLSLSVSKTIPTPTVGNFDLRRSAFSRFGLDTNADQGFPFDNEVD